MEAAVAFGPRGGIWERRWQTLTANSVALSAERRTAAVHTSRLNDRSGRRAANLTDDSCFASAFLASEDDLELLWQALEHMFEPDRSAARGEMATRGLYVFKNDSELGNAHAHDLLERLEVRAKNADAIGCDFSACSVKLDGEAPAVGARMEAAPSDADPALLTGLSAPANILEPGSDAPRQSR